ncbi:LacI family transcriptional regulator [Fodinisporobacter ferrooxydans]|uniref:LacI family transcriptional regulator n=1 Tax=Fodinisporobacter ferrooxydans TaxID=2901836 RepID=A0ABY4CIS5_9BACL|nr:LacI family transcriptional regulator [Alicyclobacillaceae bacterium MYW30-H2]
MELKLPTVHDVAKEAKVSIATVSHVLNGKKGVSERTRELVLDTVKRLGYSPNEAARSLKAGSSKLIGLVVPDQNPFFTEVLKGMQEECQKYDCQVVVANSEENEAKQKELLDLLLAHRVNGVIVAPVNTKLSSMDFFNRIPVILLDREISNLDIPSVRTDNIQGSRLATSHLIQHGHRHIGIILASPGISTTRQRFFGYIKSLEENGIEIDERLIVYGGSYAGTQSQINGGYECVHQLMSLTPRPTAIIASNYLLTVGALKALKELSIKIPDECAFIGFDDQPWQEILTPELTVISQPTFEIGKSAVQLLFSQRKEKTITLPLELVIRKSCGC